MMYGPLGALFSEMFGTRVRYTGASLGYQGATLVGAGFSPLIAGSLVAEQRQRHPRRPPAVRRLPDHRADGLVRPRDEPYLTRRPTPQAPDTPHTEEITA